MIQIQIRQIKITINRMISRNLFVKAISTPVKRWPSSNPPHVPNDHHNPNDHHDHWLDWAGVQNIWNRRQSLDHWLLRLPAPSDQLFLQGLDSSDNDNGNWCWLLFCLGCFLSTSSQYRKGSFGHPSLSFLAGLAWSGWTLLTSVLAARFILPTWKRWVACLLKKWDLIDPLSFFWKFDFLKPESK